MLMRCGVRSILYQRGVYPPETFTRIKKYGLTVLVSTDDGVKNYLASFMRQLHCELAMAGRVVGVGGAESHSPGAARRGAQRGLSARTCRSSLW